MDDSVVAPLADSFTFDGKEVHYEPGDTFASAMHRAGILEISRSMKYHRARGSYCFSGSCAGCLVEVDGRPNITACLQTACPAELESQNRIGSAKMDLLSVTDKVYRKGFDPHGAFTKPRILNNAFLKAVRFMSGVGKAPTEAGGGPGTYHQIAVDELIIGAGKTGRSRAKASPAETIILVDEGASIAAPLPDKVEVWLGALAFGIYGKSVAVRRGQDLWEVTPKRITLATGTHDGWPLFENNDLPGVISRRGAYRLLTRHDILPGKRVVMTADDPTIGAAIADLGGEVVGVGPVTAAGGSTRVEKAKVNGKWLRCDAIVCMVPPVPRLELLQQSGAKFETRGDVLVPTVDGNGETSAKGIFWLGSR